MSHTITLDDAGGAQPNRYKIIFSGETKPEKLTADANDAVYRNGNGDWTIQGQVHGGEDTWRYTGERRRHVLEYPGRFMFGIDDDDPQPATDFDVTQRDDWPGEDQSGNSTHGGDSSDGGSSDDGSDDFTVPELDTPIERAGLRFTRVARAVRDLGMDPDGHEPIGPRLARAARNHTLIKFPTGSFRIEDQTIIEDLAHFGMVGAGSELNGTLFHFPENCAERLIIRDGTGLLFDGFGIDQRAPGACPGLYLAADDDLTIQRVEWHGRGIHEDSGFESYPEETNALSVGVTSPDGVGVVKHYQCVNGGQMRNDHRGNGRIGIWALNDHRGTLDFSNIRVEECPNNGLYTSSCPGAIRVYDSVLRNNGVSQIRLSNDGSEIVGCEINYDAATSNARDPLTPGHGTQGIALDSGKPGLHGAPGARVVGCRVEMGDCAKGRGGIAVWGRSGSHTIRDCEVRVDNGARSYPDGPAMSNISIEHPDGTHGEDETGVAVVDTTCNGSAASGVAIEAYGRGVLLSDVCIRMPAGERAALDADGDVVLDSCRATVGGALNDGLCDGSFGDTRWCPDRGAGQGWTRPSLEPVPDPDSDEERRTFRIEGQAGGGRKQYILRVEQGGNVWVTDADEGVDYAEGPACFGVLVEGTDEYEFVGEITGFETIGGPVRTFVDGEECDPWEAAEQ